MTEITLATIITRGTAALLGLLAGAGTRSITAEARVIYVWHTTRGGWASAVVVISRKTGKVLRARTALNAPSQLHTGHRAMREALDTWADRVRCW